MAMTALSNLSPAWDFDAFPTEEAATHTRTLFGDGPQFQNQLAGGIIPDGEDADGDMSFDFERIPELDVMDFEANDSQHFDQPNGSVNPEQESGGVGLLVGHDPDKDEITPPMEGYGNPPETPRSVQRASTGSSSSIPSPKEWKRAKTQPKPYELRPGARLNKVPMTWVDMDESGNYDPDQERRKAPLPRKKKQTSMAGRSPTDSDEGGERIRKSKLPTWQHGHRCGTSLVVSLKFTSYAAHELLNQGSRCDNWPEDNPDCYDERDLLEEEDFGVARKLRKREAIREPVLDPRNEEDDLSGHPDARGCKLCREIGKDCSLKHRGFTWPCEDCSEVDRPCELLIPPKHKDSCQNCQANGLDCSFVCQDYEEGETAGPRCDECIDYDRPDCVAGPDYTRQPQRLYMNEYGRSDDYDDAKAPAAPRKYVACTICRQERRRCSLKTKDDKPPCNRCKKEHLACTFLDLRPTKALKPTKASSATARDDLAVGTSTYLVDDESMSESHGAPRVVETKHKPQSKGKGKEKARAEAQARSRNQERPAPKPVNWTREYRALCDAAEDEEEEEEEEIAPQKATHIAERSSDTAGHSGFTCNIITSYTHPITFDTSPYADGDSARSCTWCEENVYGILGLGEREVFCISWDNGLGYTELAGGHLAEGCRHSNMCFNCTIGRYQIILCDNHEFHRIPNIVAEDIDNVVEQLDMARPGSALSEVLQSKFCSLCVNDLAEFECATVQPSLILADTGEQYIRGCGLKLCRRCASVLWKNCGGSLQETIQVLEQSAMEDQANDEFPEFMARADIGLLKNDGLLNRNMEAIEIEMDPEAMETVEETQSAENVQDCQMDVELREQRLQPGEV
ncbi:uncharacterized protein BDZ99DRAFT_546812 [Mytilinidion resinicola]|uniref:Zn(2)-C6 fungal-type domain-containing protein n=1 Tax=Mytilinidion resinicola TaxID=574789 RepID=A0A6A6Y4Y5_9PEZI|nr:uncharacterized protein BDZ99DRAFT_546812 [Mytilinidion resinicola]KAF2803583.1 hypothetical protein BDZ99DRAFT_546812 [Mytilinidion resinicola]